MRLAGAGPIVGVTLIIVTKLLSRSQITLEFSCILQIVIFLIDGFHLLTDEKLLIVFTL